MSLLLLCVTLAACGEGTDAEEARSPSTSGSPPAAEPTYEDFDQADARECAQGGASGSMSQDCIDGITAWCRRSWEASPEEIAQFSESAGARGVSPEAIGQQVARRVQNANGCVDVHRTDLQAVFPDG